MTRSMLAALLAILFADIVQAEDSVADVSVRQPLMKLVARAEIEETCGVRGAAACTAFVGQRLDCTCERANSGWRLRAHAQLIPFIVVSDATWVTHEREHITDVREALTAHLATLGMRTFDSRESCDVESAREIAGFAALIDRFKLDSNAARHPRFAKLIEARRRK
ncbi:MAG: hypothetical protein WC538_14915 [Thermoanaerobaculia bacterium]|jgi:hypothetical protein